jgi:ketosteroid isomerase-like protein
MPTRDDDLPEVLAVAAAEPTAIERGDAEAYLALLSDEAVFLAPNTPAKRGAELRAWLSQFVRDASVEWLEYHHGETVVSGDLAVHDYAYVWRVTTKSTGNSTVSRGKGIEVFCRKPGGPWKLLRNAWNADPDPD